MNGSVIALARAAGKEPAKTTSRALQMHKNRGVAIADMKGRGLALNGGGLLGDSGNTNGLRDARVVFALSGSRLSSTFLISRTFMTNANANANSVTYGAPMVEHNAPSQLRFLGKVSSIPHPEKVHRGGEDASFISMDGKAMGVFDGVGSWQDIGIDPGLYARSLALESNACYSSTGSMNPVTLMQHAFVNSQSITGSSTACIVTIDGNMLKSSTVGDSVFFVIRDGQMLFRQRELQHGFNFPYQLGTGSRDTPECGARATVEVRDGDVVVLATDGVTDNLFDEELLAVVRFGGSAEEMADRIAKLSSEKANSPSALTPFARAVKQIGHEFDGGKLDDITVCVGLVVKAEGGVARL